METPRVSVIEVTFDEDSSDTIQFCPGDQVGGMDIFSWTGRRNGQKKIDGIYSTGAIGIYLFETALLGQRVEYNWRDPLCGELVKAYARCRKL